MNMSNVSVYAKDLYDRYGIYLLSALLIGSGSWFGYKYYRKSVERKSFAQFAESLDDYYKLAAAPTTKAAWQDAQAGLAERAKANSGSALAPYFIALQADALLKEGNRDAALATYAQVLAQLPKDSPLVPLYTIKHALIQIDSSEEATRLAGMKALQTIAADKNSPVQDMALYNLGYLAWVSNDIATAENNFRKLIVEHKDSVWAKMALAKLEATA